MSLPCYVKYGLWPCSIGRFNFLLIKIFLTLTMFLYNFNTAKFRLMRTTILFIILLLLSCQGCQDNTDSEGCGCSGKIIEEITEESAWIVLYVSDNEWYLARDTTIIDKYQEPTYLYSCQYPWPPDSLKIDSLPIIWSGRIMNICPNVKSIAINAWFDDLKKQ